MFSDQHETVTPSGKGKRASEAKGSDSQPHPRLAVWIESYKGHLMRLCQSGAKRDIVVSKKDLAAALDARSFCAICAAHKPEIDLLIKLFGLQDWFAAHAPQEPCGGLESAAQSYLGLCQALLMEQVRALSDEDLENLGYSIVSAKAAHFSGKLIHSDTQGAGMPARDVPSVQPHLSSRRLLRAGIPLPLDQVKLDNSGALQRVIKVLNDDPLVSASGLSAREQKAIQRGAKQALDDASQRRPNFVDHRLRQLLLPAGKGAYISVSPLPAGGMGVLLNQAVQHHEDAALAQAAAEAKAAASEAASEAVSESPESPESPEKPRRGRKAKSDKSDKGGSTTEGEKKKDDVAPKYKPLFERIEFPIGGVNPRNASLHWTDGGFANPLLFTAPQRSSNNRGVWRFLHRPWSAWISRDAAKKIGAQIAKLGQSSYGDSGSLAAVRVQASGSLAEWVRSCHGAAQAFARALNETDLSPSEGGLRLLIDEEYVMKSRGQETLPALDRCLLQQNFGKEYRQAMSDHLLAVLRRRTVDPSTGIGTIESAASAKRVSDAIEKLLGEAL